MGHYLKAIYFTQFTYVSVNQVRASFLLYYLILFNINTFSHRKHCSAWNYHMMEIPRDLRGIHQQAKEKQITICSL